ncbi:hypothetical protein ACFPK1_25070 [Actinomycetospora rhizophila]|uniref:Uncharacterized protein n=1 Tax=Actinomycetospora rhizophila TaxID=1416876 RepID=A0ABV9ZJA0_9PSEU
MRARILAGALAAVSAGGALLGLAGTAVASPIPGVPVTTADQCAGGGGELQAGGQYCSGGGDTGDVVVGEAAAAAMRQALPESVADPVLTLAGRR